MTLASAHRTEQSGHLQTQTGWATEVLLGARGLAQSAGCQLGRAASNPRLLPVPGGQRIAASGNREEGVDGQERIQAV